MNDFQKADLTEEFMPLAMQIAAELDNGTVPLEDLTQEAFLGLVAGLNLVAESDERGEGLPLDRTVEQAIREQVLLALAEQKDYMERDDRLVAEVELLNESINRLTGELGTKPTIDEVANDMGIPQSKVVREMERSCKPPETKLSLRSSRQLMQTVTKVVASTRPCRAAMHSML